MQSNGNELKNTSYELFIAALSVLSVLNLVLKYLAKDPVVADTIVLIDGFLTLIFLADFLYRLLTAESKSTYLLRQYGWADMLAALPLPQAKILRIFRIVRAGRLMRELGVRFMLRTLIEDRAGSALLTVLLFLILLLQWGSILMIKAESGAEGANIQSASDAVWWVYVTMTTVGYGDRFPVTSAGRMVGMLVMAAGVGLFGVLTGFLANAFLAPAGQDDEAMAPPPVTPGEEAAALQALLLEYRQLNAALGARLDAIERVLGATGSAESSAEPPG